jgi:hypothetical protein
MDENTGIKAQKDLDILEDTIKKPEFRRNKGLGNEIGYYI